MCHIGNLEDESCIMEEKRKEVTSTMDKLLTVIANCIFEYGRKGAGIPSQHGAYEEEVPQTLQNHNED